MKKIRVLIVDDSVFVRRAVKRMLSLAPDIEVVDMAADGSEAVRKVALHRPDVVTMDVQMSGMDGLTALERIMRLTPTRVLMLSSFTREGAETTIKALELGAVDFIDKGRAESAMDNTLLGNELIYKIRTISGVDVEKVKASQSNIASTVAPGETIKASASGQTRTGRVDIVAIGTSTGGPAALQNIIPRLPEDFPAGVVIVQHMPPGFTRTLAERLDAQSRLKVTEAAEGDTVEAGRVLIAPAGRHFYLKRRNGRYIAHLDDEPAESPHRPSVDVMMQSVAKACGRKGLGVLLTGMGSDGAKGMRAIKEAGGKTIAESEETCIVYGMPKSAIEEGVVDKVIPLYEVANTIIREL